MVCRIVSLLDIFEIDNNTFAIVLDLCEGGDLETYTKLHEVSGPAPHEACGRRGASREQAPPSCPDTMVVHLPARVRCSCCPSGRPRPSSRKWSAA